MIQLMNEAIKHDLTDISKVMGINLSAIGITLWGNLVDPLQVLALMVGIGYTIWKWFRDYKRENGTK